MSDGGPRRARRRLVRIALAIVCVVVVGLTAFVLVRSLRHSGSATPPSVLPPPTDLVVPVSGATPTATALPELTCDASTVVGIWAHQDDDLIFAQPDLDVDVQQGDCIRSLYVTAGDAGFGAAYYQSREFGILRAYNALRGVQTEWVRTDVALAAGPHLTVFTPSDDPRFTVAFLRLPDGGLDGAGFPTTGYQSLTRLAQGSVASLTPVDGGPPVGAAALSSSLEQILRAWHPDEVYTLVPAESPLSGGDHPDHSAVGTLVRAAATAVGIPASAVRYYLGYPSADRPANVSGDALTRKLGVYRAYADRDPVVTCATDDKCLQTRGFGQWLQRSYPLTEAELGIG